MKLKAILDLAQILRSNYNGLRAKHETPIASVVWLDFIRCKATVKSVFVGCKATVKSTDNVTKVVVRLPKSRRIFAGRLFNETKYNLKIL